MNTGQNYVGGGNYARPTEQTAKIANHITSVADGHKKDLSKLLVTVNSFFSSEDSKKTVSALNTVLQHWIQTEYKSHVREGLCDEDMQMWDTVVSNVFDTMKLITDLEKQVDGFYQRK